MRWHLLNGTCNAMIGALARRILGPDYARLLYRLIAENAWQYRYQYLVALILMLVTSGMFAAVALLLRDVITEVNVATNPGTLQWLAWLVLVIFVVRGAAMYGYMVILARIGNRIVAGLQKRIYEHIIDQGMVFHEQNRSGDLAVRISQNCQAARSALNTIAMRLGVDLTTVIGMIAVMFWNDVAMSLIALLGAPIIFGGVAALVRRVKVLARSEVALASKLLSSVNETVLGARVIKAFNLQHHMRQRTSDTIEQARDRADRIAKLQAVANPLMEAVAGASATAVMLYAGWRIIEKDMEIGTFISFLVALIMLGDPARRLAQIVVTLRQFSAGVEFIYETLDTDQRPAEPADAPALTISGGEVSFHDVTFSYGEIPALNGLDLVAQPGQVTALVGPSGAGKSTVLSLVERFYDPEGGAIRIDGQDITGVRLASLRDRMALVTQETFLFDDTIAENIRFGRPDATRPEIEEAARQANAEEFITALEQGYDSPVGEGGSQLSGGQRQRIAIARAMLRNAPILLLDEATSALDAESEARVQEALERLMEGRTSIVIAHRLATIRRADKIAVLDKGRVVEEGSHDYLVEKGGLYARLAKLQFDT